MRRKDNGEREERGKEERIEKREKGEAERGQGRGGG